MHAFDILGDPVRRRILELLADDEHASGDIVTVIGREFGITQSAVSQHLKVLKSAGLVTDRAEGTRRVYRIDPSGLGPIRAWLDELWDANLAAFKDVVESDGTTT